MNYFPGFSAADLPASHLRCLLLESGFTLDFSRPMTRADIPDESVIGPVNGVPYYASKTPNAVFSDVGDRKDGEARQVGGYAVFSAGGMPLASRLVFAVGESVCFGLPILTNGGDICVITKFPSGYCMPDNFASVFARTPERDARLAEDART